MRAIDVHVHPMNPAYVEASLPFMPAAQRMFAGKFDARPDSQIAEDYRRDDTLALAIAWDAEHGAAGGVYANDTLAQLSKDYPDVFLPGWAMVDPWRGRKGLEEIEHAIKDLGLLGVKYQPPVQGFSPADVQFYPIWDLLQSLGAPVLIHCGTTAIGAGEPGGLGFKLSHGRPIPNIDNIAADFPRLNIIAAHPGWPWTEELIAVALHKKNVSIDISGWGPKYVPAALKYDMQRRLQDKVLFGSDYPGWSPGQCCDEWQMEGFKPGVIEKLFYQNAIRILNLQAAVDVAIKAGEARQASSITAPVSSRKARPMTTKSPYIIRPEEAECYSPANHTGTKNYRLVGPKVNGAKYMEIALGDIERHEGSPAHAHPDMEQAVYILEGEAHVAINGEPHIVKTGDMMFFPAHVFHDIKVITPRIKMLVIYSPPFEEDPAKVIHMAKQVEPAE